MTLTLPPAHLVYTWMSDLCFLLALQPINFFCSWFLQQLQWPLSSAMPSAITLGDRVILSERFMTDGDASAGLLMPGSVRAGV